MNINANVPQTEVERVFFFFAFLFVQQEKLYVIRLMLNSWYASVFTEEIMLYNVCVHLLRNVSF